MKRIIYLFFIVSLTGIKVFGQKNPTEEAQPIVIEGKQLYKSEMASWSGTDLFLEKYKDKDNIGGYFSYISNDTAICIFFSKSETPKVIGTISFDSTYNLETATINFTERDFTKNENELYQIRKIALEEVKMNSDGLFKFYKNTSPNLIPLINGKEKKVYILTGPEQSGVVIFGNDYLIIFDKDNKIVNKKQLHQNIIPINYGETINDEHVEGAMHSHLPETGDFITATDICTLMLYEKFAKWKTYNVISKKYLNIWNCETNQLSVIPMDSIKNISKDQEKGNKKKSKSNKN